ncbi:hypothetical protein AYI70_g9458 [Smittium culicis]|uniref:Uncharacterized protein n=1 Tax=Smittium culicis TaxID=133412 RepID=A0A1R1XB65_9FUNG|nr:hypothetical protein AYI70_g9458 [Smittium culicis]
MDQHYMQIIQDLSENFNALMAQREHKGIHQEQKMDVVDPQGDEPHIRTRAPIMEEEFFRSPIEEDFRKDIIYERPKFIPMNYQPPPLNDAAPPNFKKTDSALYNIQLSLAQLTRLLDHYNHDQLRRKRQINAEDEDVVLMETMRELLSDLASMVIQSRIDSLIKTIELPGRAPQLIESTVKPLIENDQLDTMIAAKKTMSKNRKRRVISFVSVSSQGIASFLQRRKINQLPQPNISPKPLKIKVESTKERVAKIFLKMARIRALNRSNNLLPVWRTPRYVPHCLFLACQQ